MSRSLGWRITGPFIAIVLAAGAVVAVEPASEAEVAHRAVAKKFDRLVFKDNFRRLRPRYWTALDTSEHWQMLHGNCLKRQMVKARNGRLRIKSKYLAQPITCTAPNGETAQVRQVGGSVTMREKFDQEQGKWSVRAKFPRHDGHHSAIWMMPRDRFKFRNPLDQLPWPASGEIDIVERFPYNGRTAVQSVHYLDLTEGTSYLTGDGDGNPGDSNHCAVQRMDRFHWYTVVWKKRQMKFYVDKKLCWRHRWSSPLGGPRAPFNQPFHLILTQVAPDYSGTDAYRNTKRVMVVDKVRIYERR